MKEPRESLGLALDLAVTWMGCAAEGMKDATFVDRMAFHRDFTLVKAWAAKIKAEDAVREVEWEKECCIRMDAAESGPR